MDYFQDVQLVVVVAVGQLCQMDYFQDVQLVVVVVVEHL
jgi:hypothetical protein